MQTMDNICILGDGLLGSELNRQTGWDIISRSKDGFDIANQSTWDDLLLIKEHGVIMCYKYDTIINCIAHTDTYSLDPNIHWNVNYKGVVDLTDYCTKYRIKLVHISTDYIYSNSNECAVENIDVPVHCANWYGYTKLLGDAYVQLKSDRNLVIRSTHKPRPFPYESAWVNQYGNFDYVDIISEMIIKLISKNCNGVYNAGTECKNMYNLARRTKPDVKFSNRLPDKSTPTDVTMDLTKLNAIICE